ncbi:MAG: segregation/condensation protein A, partial [Akkermansiaceae bacterium]
DPHPEVSIYYLIRAFENLIKRFEDTRDFGYNVDDRQTESDNIDHLLNLIKPGGSLSLQSLFREATSKIEVIVTFLALLELMKMNQFKARQDVLLGQIEIERKQID